MLPVRCCKCGRAGLPRMLNQPSMFSLPVAHVRDDLPGQPCLVSWAITDREDLIEWQERNLSEIDV